MAQSLESGEYAEELTTSLLDRLARQVNSTLHSRTADSVHDVRVAIRRFAQALIVFKTSFHNRERRKIRRNLKEILSFAGEVRNRDIALELLADERSTEAAAYEAKLRAQRKEAETVLVAVLRRWVTKKSSSKWKSNLTPVQPAPLDPKRQLIRMAKKFFRSGDQAAKPHSPAVDLHRFRIQAKKFRYSMELFRPVYGAVADEWVEQIKRIQTLLGDMNDYRTTRQIIEELGGAPGIVTSLKKKEEKKVRAFRKLWDEEYSDVEGRWMASFELIPKKPVGRAGAPVKALTRAAR